MVPAKIVCVTLMEIILSSRKAFRMLTVPMIKCLVELKTALVMFQIQVNQVYLRHITHRIINPGSGDGHENLEALAIC